MACFVCFLLSCLAIVGRSGGDEVDFDANCPLPPRHSSYSAPPEGRTALASHARAGSTWVRFLVERATGKPCGFEKPDWANVLRHTGEDPERPDQVNKDGILIKTHSACYGCWKDAPLQTRLSLALNSTYSQKQFANNFGAATLKKVLSQGICLSMTGKTLDECLQRSSSKPNMVTIPCERTYDRAVLLWRHPLDNIRSNYHFRTKVLGYRGRGSWSNDAHYFPRERAEAWVNFYKTWAEFGKVRPTISVFYESLKKDPVRELRRIVDFLGFENVTDSQLHCAVDASTMERLQQVKAETESESNFFGSRKETEEKETLSFPPVVIQHFTNIGMFNISHDVLGYNQSPEETLSADDAASADAQIKSGIFNNPDPFNFGKGRSGKGRRGHAEL